MKHATKEEVELMITLGNAFDNLRANGLSEPYRMLLQRVKQEHSEQVITEWMKLYQHCFGAQSPWSVRLNSKKQKVAFWDDSKAQALGILTT